MRYKLLSLQIILFILLTGCSFAQQLALNIFSVEQGLAQSSVYDILQDNGGYLWFATEDGVSRFDGIRFKNFSQKDGLPENHIRCIIQDKKGNYWFGTAGGGLSCFNGKKFINYNSSNGLSDNYIYSLFEDSQDNIWIGTESGGAVKLRDGKFVYYNTNNGLKKNLIRSINQDRQGNIWFSYGGEGGGVTRFDGNSFRTFTLKDGLICDSVITIYIDRQNNLWFGTYNGLSLFDGKSFSNFNKKNGFVSDPVISITKDSKGILWAGTNGQGLIKFEKGKFRIFSASNGLSSNTVMKVIQDKRGDIWLGTSNGGINRLAAEKFTSFGIKDGLPAEAVYSIAEDRNGNIWFGTECGGICRYDGTGFLTYNIHNGLADDNISSLLCDRNGVLWVGTLLGGISRFENGRFRNFTTKDGLICNYVYSIIEDSRGDLWITTNEGVSRYDGSRFRNYKKENGLPDNVVYSALEDRNGDVWFATGGGVSRYNDRSFTNYTKKDGLASNRVFAVYEDKKGILWFATQAGVSRFERGIFKNYSVNEGLSNNVCDYIIEDDENIYFGTNNGINSIIYNALQSKSIPEFRVFTRKDGLAGSECTQRGAFRDSRGILWFGTSKGVTRFDPSDRPASFAPPVYISAVKVFDRLLDISKPVELVYNDNYLKIEFSAVSFSSPDLTEYLYIMEGVDKNWTSTAQRSITYPSLPPGHYIFKLKAKNSDGIWSRKTLSMSIVINPPFWETVWFRILCILIVLSSAYSFYVIKTRQVKKRNVELARLVKERTHELEQEKDKTEELLHNILPRSTVNELKSRGYVLPREIKNVSIMFTDFKGFTYIASVLPADRLVSELNDIFKNFDRIIERFGLEKLKTIGDSYMVGAGLPVESEDHAVRIIRAGMEMQHYLAERNCISPVKWEMRIGVNSGSVIAGVVGTKKFSYDIWGDTVNIASRMESAGAPGEINISAYTYMLIKDQFICEYRGKVTAKGKGEMDMYFVKGENEQLSEEKEMNCFVEKSL